MLDLFSWSSGRGMHIHVFKRGFNSHQAHFYAYFLIFSSINGILNLGPNLLWISAQLSSSLTGINLLWIWIPSLIFFQFNSTFF